MFNIKNFKYLILLSIIVSGICMEVDTKKEKSLPPPLKKEYKSNYGINTTNNKKARDLQAFKQDISDLCSSNDIFDYASKYIKVRDTINEYAAKNKSSVSTDPVILGTMLFFNHQKYVLQNFVKELNTKLSKCELKNFPVYQNTAHRTLTKKEVPTYKQPLFAVKLDECLKMLLQTQITNVKQLGLFDLCDETLNAVQKCEDFNALIGESDYVLYYIEQESCYSEQYIENYVKKLFEQTLSDVNTSCYIPEIQEILYVMKDHKIFEELYNKIANAYVVIVDSSANKNYKINVDDLFNKYKDDNDTQTNIELVNTMIELRKKDEKKSLDIIEKQLKNQTENITKTFYNIYNMLLVGFQEYCSNSVKKEGNKYALNANNTDKMQTKSEIKTSKLDNNDEKNTQCFVQEYINLAKLFSQMNNTINGLPKYKRQSHIDSVFKEIQPLLKVYQNKQNSIQEKINELQDSHKKDIVMKIHNMLCNKDAINDQYTAFSLFKKLVKLYNDQLLTLNYIP